MALVVWLMRKCKHRRWGVSQWQRYIVDVYPTSDGHAIVNWRQRCLRCGEEEWAGWTHGVVG